MGAQVAHCSTLRDALHIMSVWRMPLKLCTCGGRVYHISITAAITLQCISVTACWLVFLSVSLSRQGTSHLRLLLLLLLLLLSRFSCVQLCATPWTAAHQAPPSLGFSRQEHWSGLPFPSPMHESEKWKWSCSVVSDSLWPHGLQPTRLLHPWDFPGNNTGVGCHHLLIWD